MRPANTGRRARDQAETETERTPNVVETTVKCDKCGRIIDDGTRTLLELKSGPYRPGRPTVDLCQEHYLEFAGWLDCEPDGTITLFALERMRRDREAAKAT